MTQRRTLSDICTSLADRNDLEEYDLGPGDMEIIFTKIWEEFDSTGNADLEAALEKVQEAFGI